MKKRKIGKKAFTLLELSITIVIIGILTTVVITALSGQRTRALNTKAIATFDALWTPAHLCILGGSSLTTPPVAGTSLCGGTETWPALPTGWTYFGANSNPGNFTFSYSANGGKYQISCTEAGCTKLGF